MSTETSSDICYKFQKNLFEVGFYTIFFMVLYMYKPMGTKVCCQQEHLVISVICCRFQKKICFKSDFIHLFFPDLIHVYSPGAGADSPQGAKV